VASSPFKLFRILIVDKRNEIMEKKEFFSFMMFSESPDIDERHFLSYNAAEISPFISVRAIKSAALLL
jgi:hypothetical protein